MTEVGIMEKAFRQKQKKKKQWEVGDKKPPTPIEVHWRKCLVPLSKMKSCIMLFFFFFLIEYRMWSGQLDLAETDGNGGKCKKKKSLLEWFLKLQMKADFLALT